MAKTKLTKVPIKFDNFTKEFARKLNIKTNTNALKVRLDLLTNNFVLEKPPRKTKKHWIYTIKIPK